MIKKRIEEENRDYKDEDENDEPTDDLAETMGFKTHQKHP